MGGDITPQPTDGAIDPLIPCICGAVVDQDECPYPRGVPDTGRQLFVVNCTNENCGWQALGWGADGARKAWNHRPTRPAQLGGGVDAWLPIETAPKDGTAILVCSESGTWVAKYKSHYDSGAQRQMVWFSLMLNHAHLKEILGWNTPTHWQPLPPPPSVLGKGGA